MMDWAEDRDDLIRPRKKLFDLIANTPCLDWQLLTKRPENIARFLPFQPTENLWLGVTIESSEFIHRADFLRPIPALVKFISYEPALGNLADLDLSELNWVIFGGESGPGFRSPQGWLDWARTMQSKCARSNVAFFFKQSPAFTTGSGDLLDGKKFHEFPNPKKTARSNLPEDFTSQTAFALR